MDKLPIDTSMKNAYIVMELDLSAKHQQQPTKSFGIKTCALIGIETLLALKEPHKKGYVHRDIKANNFVIPLTSYWKHHIVILD